MTAFIIKNTFVEIDAPVVQFRRCKSAPAFCLNHDDTTTGYQECEGLSEGGSTTYPEESIQQRPEGDSCSEKDVESSSDVNADDGLAPARTRNNWHVEQRVPLNARAKPYGSVAAMHPASFISPPAMPPGCVSRCALPLDSKLEFADVLAAGQAALRRSGGQVSAESHESENGWTMTFRLREAHVQRRQLALSQCMVELLHAAENSERIYFIGYEKEPFVPDAEGNCFVARLARVQDESQVCWQFITGGSCSRGCHCTWTHPAETATLRIFATGHAR